MIIKILEFLEFFDKKKNYKYILYFLFSPIIFILEYYLNKKVWEKLILNEISNSNELVELLNKNEFGYTKNFLGIITLLKKDVIKFDDFLDNLPIKNAEEKISLEYALLFSKEFNLFAKTDIYNYIDLNVKINLFKSVDFLYVNKIFTIELSFIRKKHLINSLKYFLYLVLTIIFISFTFKFI